ncbi:MAG: PEGA domain-containing protein [Deltaproteobacteria bacterium]|nr:PEGA domain-containing protein [Deltaproteobacteria bacterium]MBI2500881.1 PEGA domain-containing protein [Deltaproteobacteria bacterium]
MASTFKRLLAGSLIASLLMAGQPLSAEPSSPLTENSLKGAIDEAQSLYENFEFEQARNLLREALSSLSGQELNHTDLLSLVPAYTLLGLLQHINGENADSLQAFEEVARLSPSTILSENDYSPTVRQIFQKAQEKVFSHRDEFGSVQISSRPKGAQVFLNGQLKGKSPLGLESLPLGPHRVSLVKEGFKAEVHRVEVSPHSSLKVSFRLEKEAPIDTHLSSDTNFIQDSPKMDVVEGRSIRKPFWRRPLFWIIAGIAVGTGTGVGLALSQGGDDSAGGGGSSSVQVQTPVLGGSLR